ncbi:MAG: putative signal transducing protein [Candidatus Aminicenantes bacterium]
MREKKKIDPHPPFREVAKAWGSAEAEVIKSFLTSHGVSCLFRGQVVQSVHPFSADGLGEIKILVAEKDYSLAKKLLQEKLNR